MKIRRVTPYLLAAMLSTSVPTPAQPLDWSPATQGNFVFALAQGADGFWVATEKQGIWRRDNGGNWRKFGRAEGLGDDSGLCLARRGAQLWVGHSTGGLSVWDGAKWTNLGVEDGLPSERVTALGVDSKSDAVWVGTENGLLQWSDANGWLVPDSPLCRRSMAGVTSAGDLVVAATACEGLVLSRDGGKSWEEVRGPQFQPNTPTGAGLPSDVLNDVKIDSLGQIWVATDTGFARSSDAGKSWFYVRGADWQANVEGSTLGFRPKNVDAEVDLAAEDWVQTLSPTDDGKIWLGFRQKGAEQRDCTSGATLVLSSDDTTALRNPNGDWVRSIIPTRGVGAITARYAGGVVPLFKANLPAPATEEKAAAPLGVPGPLPTLTAGQLEQLAAAKSALQGDLVPGSAAFESFDWRTQGDWVGRYGDRFALGYNPHGDAYNRTEGANFKLNSGPHLAPGQRGFYIFASNTRPDERHALYFPSLGERRMGEANDGTWQNDKYPFSWEGPDLWARATVPVGAHRLSIYFVNNDGRGNDLNRYRDFIVSVRASTTELADADQAPDLARGRFRDAAGGGYARFSVVGPAQFWVKIARHRSHVTKVNGLFLDFIAGAAPEAGSIAEKRHNEPMPHMGGVRYVTEATPPAQGDENETVSAARRAWAALDAAALKNGGLEGRWQHRLQIYRAAKAANAPEPLLANWRWKLTLWQSSDRETFDATMKEAREKQLAQNEAAKAAPKLETTVTP
ncbi:MAG TPA: hypothetical protein VGB45_03355 [Abditibacterium sp.]